MDVYEPGSLVTFCKSPPKEIYHCGVFEWCVGLIISETSDGSCYNILFEGEVRVVEKSWVTDIDTFANLMKPNLE